MVREKSSSFLAGWNGAIGWRTLRSQVCRTQSKALLSAGEMIRKFLVKPWLSTFQSFQPILKCKTHNNSLSRNINELRLQRPDVIEITWGIKSHLELEGKAEKCLSVSSSSSNIIS